MQSPVMIKASEIGDYIYCKRCWYHRYLGLNTLTTQAMDAGAKQHTHLSTQTHAFKKRALLVLLLLLISILALLLLLAVR